MMIFVVFLKEQGFDDIEWGEDFGAPHEMLLQIIMIYQYLLQIIRLR